MHSFSLILCLVLSALYGAVLAVPLDHRDNYTGVGGQSSGGDVANSGGLINLGSFNAGDAGPAKSGDAGGGHGRDGQHNSYSGAGGGSKGGSVSGTTGMINLFSGNAGNGDDASSGLAGDSRHGVGGCDC